LTPPFPVLLCAHVVVTLQSQISQEEERMATAQRNPRDVIFEAGAEYQRLAQQHQQYEAALKELSLSVYHNSEDLLEEIRLKKLKLHVKDEMERIASRIPDVRAKHTPGPTN
jgi:hypothetical protein